MKRLLAITVIALVAMIGSAPAALAANCGTSITASSLPCTIASPGNYILTGYASKAFTASAITVAADNVVLDLGGYEIRTTTPVTGYGIVASGIRKNVLMKNGTVIGFLAAVDFEDSTTGHMNIVIDGMRSVNSTWDGFRADGSAIIIRNCQVYCDALQTGDGIVTKGSNISIINNDVIGTVYTGIVANKLNGVGMNNLVENNRVSGLNAQVGEGITVQSNVSIVNNRVANATTGIGMHDGSAGGIYRDNLVLDSTTPYDIGATIVNAGNNTYFPQ